MLFYEALLCHFVRVEEKYRVVYIEYIYSYATTSCTNVHV